MPPNLLTVELVGGPYDGLIVNLLPDVCGLIALERNVPPPPAVPFDSTPEPYTEKSDKCIYRLISSTRAEFLCYGF